VRTTYDKHGRLSFLNAICKVYLTVIRGTPMTVQLLIAYYVIFASSNNGTLVAIIAFGVNSGAYVAEIMRAGICSIDEGQMEAGRSLGMSYLQGLRHIVLPQAFRNVLPALGNEFIVLLKDTSIASFIALRDLSKGGEIIRSQTYDAFMPFLMVALVYLVIVMFFTKLLEKLERRLQSSNAH
jgi:ABC-type amino acid transport system permease subunit